MKTISRLVVILAFWAARGSPLSAQELGAPRPAGRVLLLQGDRGLEGDIEKVGEQYRVRRGTSEMWLPADKALRLCPDWQDAYAFMKTRANLGDPQERLRLARWCQQNNLRPQALIEAKVALEMRPAHEESRQLVTMLTRSVASPPVTPLKSPAAQAAAIKVVSLTGDISSDSFALFATRVQPILMNTCVNCHSGGRGGAFQLLRTEGGQRGFTQANLAAVLAQVKADNPALSPLLIKAVSPHGNVANAPIKDRQTIPFKTLQGWIDSLLANNPHLKCQETEAALATAKKTLEPVAFAQAQAAPQVHSKPMAVSRPAPRAELPKETSAAVPLAPDARPLAAPAKIVPPSSSGPGTSANEERESNALDAFDPAIFNRQMHPRKSGVSSQES